MVVLTDGSSDNVLGMVEAKMKQMKRGSSRTQRPQYLAIVNYPAKNYVRQTKIREGDGDRIATIGRGVRKAFARTILCACSQLALHPLLVVSCVEPFKRFTSKRATMPEFNQIIAQHGNTMDECGMTSIELYQESLLAA